MTFDIGKIHKLNPGYLLDVAGLAGFIAYLLTVVQANTPFKNKTTARQVLSLSRVIARLQKQLRDNKNFNFNLRLKAWVFADPRRVAFVRRIIGEPAIKRWKKRFGGVLEPIPTIPPMPKLNLKLPKQGKPYVWKLFTLTDVYYIRIRPIQPIKPIRPITPIAPISLRGARGFKPAEFWPVELEPGYVPDAWQLHQDDREKPEVDADAGDSDDGDVEAPQRGKPHPPPKSEKSPQEPSLAGDPTKPP